MRLKSYSSSSKPLSTDSNGTKQSLNEPPPMIDLAKWVDTTVTAMNGKVFESATELIPVDQAKVFPTQDCFCLLEGEPASIPHDIVADVKVVMFSFRHYGFSLLRSWMDVLDEQKEVLSNAKNNCNESTILSSQIQMVEICYIETGIFSMAKNMMAKSVRNKVESNRLSNSYLKFGGIMVSSCYSLFVSFFFQIFNQRHCAHRILRCVCRCQIFLRGTSSYWIEIIEFVGKHAESLQKMK